MIFGEVTISKYGGVQFVRNWCAETYVESTKKNKCAICVQF